MARFHSMIVPVLMTKGHAGIGLVAVLPLCARKYSLIGGLEQNENIY